MVLLQDSAIQIIIIVFMYKVTLYLSVTKERPLTKKLNFSYFLESRLSELLAGLSTIQRVFSMKRVISGAGKGLLM